MQHWGPFGFPALITSLYRTAHTLEMSFFQLFMGFKSQ